MVMLVAMSIVILASYSAKAFSFKAYAEIIHRERAQLYAAETLEQLKALQMTQVQVNYLKSWQNFLGGKSNGDYQLVSTDTVSSLGPFLLVQLAEGDIPEDSSWVKTYEPDYQNDFFARLERRIAIQEIPAQSGEPQKKLVSISVYWGIKGKYSKQSSQQINFQSIFSDQVGPAFAL